MRKTLPLVMLVVICSMTLVACSEAEPSDRSSSEGQKAEIVKISDKQDENASSSSEEQVPNEEQQQQEEPVYEEYVVYDEYDESLNNNPAYLNGGNHSYGDGFQQQGVRDYNGTTETWYSSNQTYHYRTEEWSVDDEGYYRDAEGYYVVASEDHAEGEVFETSKGEAKVYDGGCDNGVTDFYVNW